MSHDVFFKVVLKCTVGNNGKKQVKSFDSRWYKLFVQSHKNICSHETETSIRSQSGTKPVAVNPELVFRRALVISECCDDLSLEKVMSHPIRAVLSSMFHEDGNMRKNAKPELTLVLENHAASVGEIFVVLS